MERTEADTETRENDIQHKLGGINADILSTVGWTPLVRLNKIASGLKVDISAKLEFLNPTGSVKDRMALFIIEDAEKKRALKARWHHCGELLREYGGRPRHDRCSEGLPLHYYHARQDE